MCQNTTARTYGNIVFIFMTSSPHNTTPLLNSPHLSSRDYQRGKTNPFREHTGHAHGNQLNDCLPFSQCSWTVAGETSCLTLPQWKRKKRKRFGNRSDAARTPTRPPVKKLSITWSYALSQPLHSRCTVKHKPTPTPTLTSFASVMHLLAQ